MGFSRSRKTKQKSACQASATEPAPAASPEAVEQPAGGASPEQETPPEHEQGVSPEADTIPPSPGAPGALESSRDFVGTELGAEASDGPAADPGDQVTEHTKRFVASLGPRERELLGQRLGQIRKQYAAPALVELGGGSPELARLYSAWALVQAAALVVRMVEAWKFREWPEVASTVTRTIKLATAVVEAAVKTPEHEGPMRDLLHQIAMKAREEAAISEAGGVVAPWRSVVWRALVSAAGVWSGDEGLASVLLPGIGDDIGDTLRPQHVAAKLLTAAFGQRGEVQHASL